MKLKNSMIAAVFLLLCGQAHSAAIGARGGKKSVARMIDSSGYPIQFNDDKPWKVFESTGVNPIRVVDESGVAPVQGMVRQICLSTAATSVYAVAYDSGTTGYGTLSVTAAGARIAPPLVASATVTQCLQVNALFTSGLWVELSAASGYGGVYVYWRELGGYR